MFLNPNNLLNDIKSTSVTLHQISDYHIFEIFVTREKLKFAAYDTDEYKVFLEPDAFCARINDNNEQVDYRRIKIDENEVYFNNNRNKLVRSERKRKKHGK